MMRNHPLYRGLVSLLKDVYGEKHRTIQKRLASALMGIFASGTIVLHRIATHQSALSQNSTTVESYERSLRRDLDDSRLTWRSFYVPFLRKMLVVDEETETKPTLHVAIDETTRKGDFCVLVAAVVCHGRCIPLAWQVRRAQQKKKEGFFFCQVKKLLRKVHCLFGNKYRVVVLGDRAFGTPEFTDLVEENGFEWVVRLQKQTCFASQDTQMQLYTMLSKPGDSYKGRGKLFKKAGWREGTLECVWSEAYKEPMFVGSSLDESWNLVELYKKRATIECLFRDWKSGGWQWESSQVQDLEHQKRQILWMAMATVLTLAMGQKELRKQLQTPKTPRTSRPFEAKQSMFQMGLQALRSCLYQTQKFPNRLALLIESQQINASAKICLHRAHSSLVEDS